MSSFETIHRISQEESHWRTVYFDDLSSVKNTKILEKEEQNGYRFATVEGTDIGILDRLNDIPMKEIPRNTALELRQKYDHNWAGRIALQNRAIALQQWGLLEPLGSGALGASLELQDSHQAAAFSLTIQEDGSLSTLIHEPAQWDEFDGRAYRMDWHEYELPRHVSYGIHRVQHTERSKSIPKTIYNPLTIVRVMIEWFKVAEKIGS